MKELTREKKLHFTTYSSVIYQIVTIVSGFILPRFFLSFWGSDVNGLVSSISQFLSVISFLDMGVGQVVQSALYKPLADGDHQKASEVLTSGRKFFKKLAFLFLIYTIILTFVYPFVISSTFDYWYIASLILILSINSFAQYYFGVNYQMLLNSDQRGYVQYFIQTITIILNMGIAIILLYAGCGLHVVKFSTALIFLLRPFLMWIYIRKNYPTISFNEKLTYEPLKQKWDGLAQHVASVVLTNTDVIVLTVFSTFANVSVYSVYNLVITGVKQLFVSATTGIQAVFGELWASGNINELKRFFSKIEWIIHTSVTIAFGATASLIVPFVSVYTKGITDANYIQPLFAVLIVFAHAGHCLRLPYNMMVMAGGHFRQTQFCYIVSAILNIIISIVMVWKFGLIGVAVGTLVAMLFQTIWLAYYLKNNILKLEIKLFWKQILIDFLTVAIAFFISSYIKLLSISYFSWILLAIEKTSIYIGVALLFNIVFYNNNVKELLKKRRKNQ